MPNTHTNPEHKTYTRHHPIHNMNGNIITQHGLPQQASEPFLAEPTSPPMKVLADGMHDGVDDYLKEMGHDAYSVKKLANQDPKFGSDYFAVAHARERHGGGHGLPCACS